MTTAVQRALTGGLGPARRMLEEKLGGPARLRAITLLAAVLSVDSADKGAIGALAPQLESHFHIGNLDLGLLAAVSSLVGAAATLPMGVLTDRTPRVRLLWISILAWGAAEAVSAISFSFVMLLLTRVLLGCVTAAAGPAVGSLTGDLFPAKERSRIYGYILTGELLGAGAGLLIAGDIGSAIDWRAGFLALVVPSLLLAWVLKRFLPEPARGGQSHIGDGDEEIVPAEEAGAPDDRPQGEEDDEPEPGVGPSPIAMEQIERRGIEANPETVITGDPARLTVWEAVRWVIRVRTNVLLIVSSCLGYFFFAGLKTFAVVFARGRYGISESEATLLAVVVGGAGIVGVIGGGRTADRLLARGRLNARLVVAAIGYLTAAAVFVPAFLTTSLAVALPLVLLAAASLSAPNSPGDAARLDIVPSRMWGRTEAIRTFIRTILEAFAPLLFGFVSQVFGSGAGTGFGAGVNNKAAHVSAAQAHGLAYAFLIMLVPLAAAGYFILRARRSYPTDVASAAESEQRSAPAGKRRFGDHRPG